MQNAGAVFLALLPLKPGADNAQHLWLIRWRHHERPFARAWINGNTDPHARFSVHPVLSKRLTVMRKRHEHRSTLAALKRVGLRAQKNRHEGGCCENDKAHHAGGVGQLGSAGLGEDISDVSRMIDVVDSPSACKGPDCYAVFISGDSMEPAMRSGMVAYVAPSLPVRARDFVVVQMRPAKTEGDLKPQTAVIKEYKAIVEEEDGAKSVRVRQYNPPLDIKLKNVDQIHRVVAVEFV